LRIGLSASPYDLELARSLIYAREAIMFLGYFWWEWLLIASGAIIGASIFRKLMK